ncbi:MAG: ATP-grasp domain-containing protein [Spirochaetales bacterium]|nr:ATP-grasp domain-containing protein [Spirochaetales bacterium]MCF7937754.1 ATP-grasp domain-containing protein [Spirochaetales bacterium]
MRDITVLVTAVGCPGASTFLRYLRDEVQDRSIRLIGVDMNEDSIGRFMVDRFYSIPAAADSAYLDRIQEIITKEKPDVFFCVSSMEVPIVAKHRETIESLGVKVIVSPPEAVEISENKYRLYKNFENIEEVPVPEYRVPKNLDEFVQGAKELGYPNKRVAFKPHVSKGSRGFRIIDDSISRRDLLMNYKPDNVYISMDEFIKIFQNEPDFPDFLLMEYVDGEEIDAMVLSRNRELLIVTTKTREQTRAGVIMTGELVHRPHIERACRRIVEEIPLEYNSGIQFKGGRLIEINTRVSTFIYQNDLIEPYLSIQLALEEIMPEQVKAYQDRVDYGRRMIRYMDQVFYKEGNLVT